MVFPKSFFVIICSFLGPNSLIGQDSISLSFAPFYIEKGYEKGEKRFGSWVQTDAQGDTTSVYNFNNDDRHGPFQRIIENQRPSYQSIRENPQLILNIQPKKNVERGTYENGLLEGPRSLLHTNGILIETGHFQKGIRDGVFKSYRKDGTNSILKFYKRGKLSGDWTSFHENGKIRESRVYNKGILVSSTTVDWYDNGNCQISSSFLHQKGQKIIHGIWYKYFENGQIETVSVYNEGRPDGVWLGYFESGTLKYKMTYKKGKFISFEDYNEDGSLKK